MNSITKKQASLALVVVAFAAIMIAGTIAASTDSAFAHKVKNHQSIKQHCKNNQRSIVSSSSLIGDSTSTNVPINVCVNANSGNNIADNSNN